MLHQVGGFLEPEELPPELAVLMAEVLGFMDIAVQKAQADYFPRFQGRALQFSPVRSQEINAFACAGEISDHVVLFGGLLQAVYGTINSALANRSFFPGLHSLEEDSGLHSSLPWSDSGVNIQPSDTFLRPRNAERRNLATLLCHQALKICLLHELGHVNGGHCDVAKQVSGVAARLQERHKIAGATGHLKTLLVEMDADHFAAAYLGIIIHGFAEHPPQDAQELSSLIGLSDLDSAAAWTALNAFAAFFLFKVLHPAIRPSWEVNPECYPPTFIRPWLILERMLPSLNTEASRAIGDELGKLEAAWWRSVSSPSPAYEVSDWDTQVLRAHGLCWNYFVSGSHILDEHRRTQTNWHPRVS